MRYTRTLLSVISLISAIQAWGLEAADTVATQAADTVATTQLKEFVVEGASVRMLKDGVEYTPDKKAKKHAMDATGLLNNMQIPQLRVDGETVKTLAGQDVSMFIDYAPATAQDLSGMRTEDVLRVEVLQYPDDPRFNGAQNVVNYIMQKYEWGGYTKLGATGRTFDYDYIQGTVYSKFVRKKWTVDASANASWTHSDNDKDSETNIFRDINYGGSHYDEVSRRSAADDMLKRSNRQFASLRATYDKDWLFIRHGLTFSRSGTPYNFTHSILSYNPEIITGESSTQRKFYQQITPGIYGFYRFTLPKGNSISLDWSYDHSENRSRSSYDVEGLTPIINNNRERVEAPYANLCYSKKFPKDNTLRIALMTFNYIYHTEYSGSYNGLQKLLSSENMLFIEYIKNWKSGLRLYSRIGASYVVGRVNGVNTLEQWNPRLGVSLQYTISSKQSANAEFWWGNSHPGADWSNSAMVQSNELMWLQGNPDLRNTEFCTVRLGYNLAASKKFNLAANLEYVGNYHVPMYDYVTEAGYDGLVRRVVNAGKYHEYNGRVSASLNLFDKALRLKAIGHVCHSELTGLNGFDVNSLMGQLQASAYVGNFMIQGNFFTPEKMTGAFQMGWVYKAPIRYGIAATYALGDLKVQMWFWNWFEKEGRLDGRFDSRQYSSASSVWMSTYTRRINLSVNYTFGYGKKVKRGNEISESGGASSAILK